MPLPRPRLFRPGFTGPRPARESFSALRPTHLRWEMRFAGRRRRGRGEDSLRLERGAKSPLGHAAVTADTLKAAVGRSLPAKFLAHSPAIAAALPGAQRAQHSGDAGNPGPARRSGDHPAACRQPRASRPRNPATAVCKDSIETRMSASTQT